MNADGLTRLYSALTAEERLALAVAAASRRDEAEQARLIQSAPVRSVEQSEHARFARALDKLADVFLLGQLDLAARIWRWLYFVESQQSSRKPKQTAGSPPVPTPLFCYLLGMFLVP